MKNKLIVFRLKNNFLNDPVDRLRGIDIYLELKKNGWNVELFNEQRNIDLLISLDDDYKSFYVIDNFNPKKIILDLQDDHLTMNKKSLSMIKGHTSNKYNRVVNIVRNKGFVSLLFIYLYKKISKILLKMYLKKVDYILCSSESLRKIVAPYNSNNICIPDSLDFNIYKKKQYIVQSNNVSIVWIGTASNIKYLLIINEILEKLQNKFNVEIKIITSTQIYKDKSFSTIIEKFKFKFKFIEWSIHSFAINISDSDIGIAPLPKGIAKSTNKILSYMASGIPVVCSGSVDYENLHKNNKEAFYYSDNINEWYEILSKLIKNIDLRQEIAEKGYSLSTKFSLENILKEYEKIFKKVLNEE